MIVKTINDRKYSFWIRQLSADDNFVMFKVDVITEVFGRKILVMSFSMQYPLMSPDNNIEDVDVGKVVSEIINDIDFEKAIKKAWNTIWEAIRENQNSLITPNSQNSSNQLT